MANAARASAHACGLVGCGLVLVVACARVHACRVLQFGLAADARLRVVADVWVEEGLPGLSVSGVSGASAV